MDDVEVNKLVDQWIKHWKWRLTQPKDENDEHHNWLNPTPRKIIPIPPEYEDCAWDLLYADPEFFWRFILCACERKLSDRMIGMLAAGPLEDFLSWVGPDYIDRVEDLAKWDDKFNHLLGGVWKKDMDDQVWERVQKVRREVL